MSIMAASAVESDRGRGMDENVSVPSQELPDNPELEEPTAHEEADKVESQVDIITSSTNLEGHGAAEDTEEEKDFIVKEVDLTCFSYTVLLTGPYVKAKHDFDPVPEVNNLEHEVETEATAEPPLSSTIEQDLPTTLEPERDAHSDEVTAEDSSKVAPDLDAAGGIEHQSELEEETLAVLSPSTQETEADVLSSSKDALTAQKVETEVEAGTQGTDAATTTNEIVAVESSEAEQLVIPTAEVFIFCSCVMYSLTWLFL